MHVKLIQGHRFLFVPDVEPNGFYWYVECLTCGSLVTPATLYPSVHVDFHISCPGEVLTIEEDVDGFDAVWASHHRLEDI